MLGFLGNIGSFIGNAANKVANSPAVQNTVATLRNDAADAIRAGGSSATGAVADRVATGAPRVQVGGTELPVTVTAAKIGGTVLAVVALVVLVWFIARGTKK